jgi:hypothetical protein
MPSSMPTDASITHMLVGAYEMNGSGTPVSGANPSTTKMLRIPWQRISEVSPVASSFAYRPAARRAVRSPA